MKVDLTNKFEDGLNLLNALEQRYSSTEYLYKPH